MLDNPSRGVTELTSFIEETEPFEYSLETVRKRLKRGPGHSQDKQGSHA